MPRCVVFVLSFATVFLLPMLASAREECPDGWFCDESGAPAQPAVEPAQPVPPPSPPAANPQPAPAYPPGFYTGPLYYYAPPPPPPPPKKKKKHRSRKWGFNLHLDGAFLSDRVDDEGAMGGAGFSFRFRPVRALALEASFDFVRGFEHDRFFRSENAFSLNTLFFFNPRSVVQIYALGGIDFSRAYLNSTRRSGDDVYYDRSDEYFSYFGGHLGLGLEIRVSPLFAIGADFSGFLRGHSDRPEDHSATFVTNRALLASDTSGGVLRTGVTFYW